MPQYYTVTASYSASSQKFFLNDVTVTQGNSTIVITGSNLSQITIGGLPNPPFSSIVSNANGSEIDLSDQNASKQTFSYTGGAKPGNQPWTTFDPQITNDPGGLGHPGVVTLGRRPDETPPPGPSGGSPNVAPQGSDDGAHDPGVSDLDEP